MNTRVPLDRGISAALGAALLFGAATPLAKSFLQNVGPWMLASLFYLGSGVGLACWRTATQSKSVRLTLPETGWLAAAVLCGGVMGPVLLMYGLHGMPASGASLLLNAEGVFTALIAWYAFHENFDQRIAWGMASIALGAVVLSWPGDAHFARLWPALAILGACLFWSIDNNLTRKVAHADATWIAALKGLVAGCVNLILALAVGDSLPDLLTVALTGVVGFLCYGVSLALFVVGLRHLGTARTGAYFSIAPFLGALLGVASGETLTLATAVAGLLMAFGVWLHLTESHSHAHEHDWMAHEHEHIHDEHHQHSHPNDSEPAFGSAHTHWHVHEPMVHAHAHFPDAHHLHRHG